MLLLWQRAITASLLAETGKPRDCPKASLGTKGNTKTYYIIAQHKRNELGIVLEPKWFKQKHKHQRTLRFQPDTKWFQHAVLRKLNSVKNIAYEPISIDSFY